MGKLTRKSSVSIIDSQVDIDGLTVDEFIDWCNTRKVSFPDGVLQFNQAWSYDERNLTLELVKYESDEDLEIRQSIHDISLEKRRESAKIAKSISDRKVEKSELKELERLTLKYGVQK